VAPGGYAWWYVDAISDDGEHALTLIAFIGSVFSPYYFAARQRGPVPAENHVAMNVALYRPNRWAMTERGAKSLSRDKDFLRIGPSRLDWDGTALHADIDEITVPVPRRLRGRFKLTPARIETQNYSLDAQGRHRWRPIAPRARIEVAFSKPELSWRGNAYFDCNEGDVPLEEDFASWNWSRAAKPAAATVLYDVRRRDGESHGLALNFDGDGSHAFTPPPLAALPKNSWGVARETRADVGFVPAVQQEFEAAPFYTRGKVATRLHGEEMVAVHESLDLDRFSASWVRTLLPFRMPRKLW
jgi:carotenoid 1,2-hydratase